MEQQLPNALEQISNPILSILIIILIGACSGLWFAYMRLQQRLMEALLQNVGALTNINATLSNMKERLDGIEEGISKN
jgi:hypothetical protein